jgi:hypothetical protein
MHIAFLIGRIIFGGYGGGAVPDSGDHVDSSRVVGSRTFRCRNRAIALTTPSIFDNC